MKGKEIISKIKFNESYAKFIHSENRMETWEESCRDVMNMHYNKFSKLNTWGDIEPYFNDALNAYINQEVLASQRNLQFREKHIIKHNAKIFNCSSTYIDRIDVFKEIMWVLLCGCGVGYSVESRFVDSLPKLNKRSDKSKVFIIEDSIEGWALAIDALIKSYVSGARMVFDYSQIRKKGSLIAGEFLAPGHEGLMKSIELIERILDQKTSNGEYRLTSLDCHDIICIMSDAVLSGGVRRSALICIFDKTDELMANCKTGEWYIYTPWRARANNSAKLLKNELTEDEFNKYKEAIKQYGEPGVVLVDDIDFNTNPCCFSGETKILTPSGYKEISSIVGEVKLIDRFGNEVDGKVWSNGVKEVCKMYLSNRKSIIATPCHRFLNTNEEEVVVEKLKGHKLMPFFKINKEITDFVKYGYIQGDGVLSRLSSTSHLGLEINIGEKDDDILGVFNLSRTNKERVFYVNGFNDILKELKFCNNISPQRVLPLTYKDWGIKDRAMFLKGLYSANGSVIKRRRISFKTTSKVLSEQLIESLSDFGIKSYITTNKSKKTSFSNGDYICKESYDVNISRFDDILKFSEIIGFVHLYKQEALRELIKHRAPKVRSVKNFGEVEVFDFALDNEDHWGVIEGVVAHNCEIGFIPRNSKNGKSCFNFCNLNEIIGSKCNTAEDFYKACRNAAVIGTFQASYTDFAFLGKDTEELVREEALLGISITGFMNNPQVLFNPEILRNGAEIVKETNEAVAKLIGINPAARLTCVKPSGNASVLAKTASGIHPPHAKNYFRVIQLNKETPVAKHFAENHSEMLEEGVWSSSNSDYAVYTPIVEPEGSIVKNQINEIDFVYYIKLVYENWVLPGTIKERGYSNRITHNVSNTITVSDWDKVFKHIFENKESFCGLSFLPSLGDKVYKQSPFTEVLMLDDLVSKYGDAAIFASGLIVDAIHCFNGDLWDACSASTSKEFVLTGDRVTVFVKKDLVTRVKKFAKNYFKGNANKATECLKDVHLYHKWVKITRAIESNPILFEKINYSEKYQNIDELGGLACSGGSCEINF